MISGDILLNIQNGNVSIKGNVQHLIQRLHDDFDVYILTKVISDDEEKSIINVLKKEGFEEMVYLFISKEENPC